MLTVHVDSLDPAGSHLTSPDRDIHLTFPSHRLHAESKDDLADGQPSEACGRAQAARTHHPSGLPDLLRDVQTRVDSTLDTKAARRKGDLEGCPAWSGQCTGRQRGRQKGA